MDDPRTSQKSPTTTLHLVGEDATDGTKMLLMSRISPLKAWPPKHIYLKAEYSLILFREIRHYQQSEKGIIIQKWVVQKNHRRKMLINLTNQSATKISSIDMVSSSLEILCYNADNTMLLDQG